MEKLGLIAGNGRFPILFAKGARDNNVPIIAVGIEGETSPEIEQYVEKLYWVGVAQIGKLIKVFKQERRQPSKVFVRIVQFPEKSPLQSPQR